MAMTSPFGVTPAFESALAKALDSLGERRMRDVADRFGRPDQVGDVGLSELYDAAAGMAPEVFAAYVRGAAFGHRHHERSMKVESVWSGPVSHGVPVRQTAVVLHELIDSARHDLLLVTYAAHQYPRLIDGLLRARDRGVRVSIVVETLTGAGAALSVEPARAFGEIPGAELWQWPVGKREKNAKLHAKIVVADRSSMLLSSANLTGFGATHNIEAGVLITGGSAPKRATEHIEELMRSGLLSRL